MKRTDASCWTARLGRVTSHDVRIVAVRRAHSPRRGGTRGGQADFSWDVVREDKHRENYLGNSIAAPKGRWQQGRDILWYNRDTNTHDDNAAEKRKQELLRVKQAEQDAMNQMLYVVLLT